MSARIAELSECEELSQVAELFAVVWGRPGKAPISSDILKALAHSGNYISGASVDGRLIGGLLGWLRGTPPHELLMHSHILGVLPGSEARGVGVELKQPQRPWCLAPGVEVIELTTHPPLRRHPHL